MPHETLKPKDLMGLPWRVAFALQDDGWWLARPSCGTKPNLMPESVRDRPTNAYEMTTSPRYFYDEAIRVPASAYVRANDYTVSASLYARASGARTTCSPTSRSSPNSSAGASGTSMTAGARSAGRAWWTTWATPTRQGSRT